MTKTDMLRTFGCGICGCGPDYMDDDCHGCDQCGHGYVLAEPKFAADRAVAALLVGAGVYFAVHFILWGLRGFKVMP